MHWRKNQIAVKNAVAQAAEEEKEIWRR